MDQGYGFCREICLEKSAVDKAGPVITFSNHTPMDKNSYAAKSNQAGRRAFVRQGLIITASGLMGMSLINSCKEKDHEDGQEVSPPEDLMQEHGVLNRILLIYDHCREVLQSGQAVPVEHLSNAAGIIRSFVEDYHEKQEEQYLFPRFEKANQLTDLVSTLRQQHKAGRVVTDKIVQLCKSQNLSEADRQALTAQLAMFNTMYRPHESREDTVLFPAFRKLVSRHEYDSLGEEFEKNEHRLFGEGGFEMIVEKVSGIEKALGIYDLAQFTPKL
jgi:hemerythrin-like domain-containing protein